MTYEHIDSSVTSASITVKINFYPRAITLYGH